jgi:hypothetical protein
LLLLIAALSGCMRIERTLHLNSDGTGYYTLTLGFREPHPGDPTSVDAKVTAPLEAFATEVRATGGSTSRAEDQGYAYWGFTRPFSSVVEANALLREDPRQYDANDIAVLFHDSLHVVRETRLSSAVFHVTGTLSLADALNKAQDWRDASESLSITMAGGLISQQGGIQQGNTVTYTISYNQSATIDVIGRVSGASDVFITDAPYIIAGSLLALSVMLAVVGVRLLRGAARSR